MFGTPWSVSLATLAEAQHTLSAHIGQDRLLKKPNISPAWHLVGLPCVLFFGGLQDAFLKILLLHEDS